MGGAWLFLLATKRADAAFEKKKGAAVRRRGTAAGVATHRISPTMRLPVAEYHSRHQRLLRFAREYDRRLQAASGCDAA